MNKTPWTPGPWTADTAYRVDKDYGRIPLIVPVNAENPVAEITVDYEEETLRANARLIAAAPEMAELMGNILKDLDDIVNPMMITLGLHPLDLNTKATRELLSVIWGSD